MVGALTFLMGNAESIKSGTFGKKKGSYNMLNMKEAFEHFLAQMELVFLAPLLIQRFYKIY